MVPFWTRCLDTLRDEIPDNLYNLWIRPLQVRQNEQTLVLLAPNPYFVNEITTLYETRINELVQQYSNGSIKNVVITVLSSALKSAEETTLLTDYAHQSVGLHQGSNDYAIKAKRGKKNAALGRSLNPLFTFSQFVEGPSNQMAYQTSHKVLDKLGDPQHNPLFLYGPTGLGKTHLMHAVGHNILERKQNARVMYITSEQFVGSFVSAIQQHKMEQFKKDFRTLDLLLVDDIHLLAGKEASLSEFFYTFNALMEDSRQIILTSDRYPKELTELDARLVSRFSWGLSVGIDPPDLETRIEILFKKASQTQVELSRHCALFIAQQVMGNVRELEGALNKVMATARFKGIEISLDIVRESLKDVVAIRARTISIDNIQRVVEEYFRIPHKDLIGPKRTRILARPRQLAMGLARELTQESFPEIGQAFGGRDHSTVMHACEKVMELRQIDPTFAEDYRNLLRLLQN